MNAESKLLEVDGFVAKEDLTHLSEDQLAGDIINRLIHLAHLRGVGIDRILISIASAYSLAKLFHTLTEAIEDKAIVNIDGPVM